MKIGFSKKCRNGINKSIIYILIIGCAIILLKNPLSAGPFLKIDRIDYESEFPKARVYITVRNADNRPAIGLNEENIFLFEDEYRVNYVRVKNLAERDGFLYIVYSIDSSKSISIELLAKIKNEAEKLLGSSHSHDMIAIYKFNDNVELLNNFTSNRVEILKSIEKIERHGTKTLLYDAIYSSLNLLHMSEVERKAVIVFTDGKDEGSSIKVDDIVKFARETHIPVYCISLKSTENTRALARISLLTGGIQMNIGEKDISDVYKKILGMINQQYVIDYQSMLEPDGEPHNLEVRLKFGNIYDMDKREVVIKRRLFPFNIPFSTDIIIISLAAIFILILVLLLIYAVKKIGRNSSVVVSKPEPASVAAVVQDREGEDVQIVEVPAEEEMEDGQVYTKTWLVERDGKDAGGKIPVNKEEFTIGRDAGNSIVIEDRNVSPRHAKIKRVKGAYYLFDLASDSGTYLNGNKLLRPKLLYDWDEIRVGKRAFIFRGSNIA